MAQGLWNTGALSPYLFLLTGESKTAVGVVQGLTGVATIIASLPVGLVSDLRSRRVVARASAVFDAVAVALTLAAVTVVPHGLRYATLIVSAVVWGFSGACDPSLDALYADSVATGQRAAAFTHLLALARAARGAGTLIAAAIFAICGNEWTLRTLAAVIVAGVLIGAVPMAFKLLVHDRDALGAESEAIDAPLLPPSVSANGNDIDTACAESDAAPLLSPSGPVARAVADAGLERAQGLDNQADQRQTPAGDVCIATPVTPDATGCGRRISSAERGAHGRPGVRPILLCNGDTSGAPLGEGSAEKARSSEAISGHSITRNGCASTDAETGTGPRLRRGEDACLLSRPRSSLWIPVFLSCSDIVSGLASGMTIKFFPIFFMDEVKLPPIQNSFLFAAMPICIALSMVGAQRAAAAAGRLPAILALKWTAVGLLAVMGAFPCIWHRRALIVTLFLTRTASANCTAALSRSLLMDYVPKALRGRWSCLDGVTTFGWSGSALLGGFLIDRAGFHTVFLATAALQAASTLPLLPLLLAVPRREAALAHEGVAAEAVVGRPPCVPKRVESVGIVLNEHRALSNDI